MPISFPKVVSRYLTHRATDSMEGLAVKKKNPRTWRLLELLERIVDEVGDEVAVVSEEEGVHDVAVTQMASMLTWQTVREARFH